MKRQHSFRSERGLSLIEVLVGTLLISLALLGLVSLQARTVQLSAESEDSQRASLLASDLASEMWAANSLTVSADRFDDWKARVADATAGGLPNGEGTVELLGGRARITITWSPPRADGATSRYVTEVLIPVPPAASAAST